MRCVVQLPHPGSMDRRLAQYVNRVKPWAHWAGPGAQKHSRAFIEAQGRALRSAEPSDVVEGHLRFWGEWEADAKVTDLGPGRPGHPRYLQQPVIRRPDSYRNVFNTDPFVFDGPFLYALCRQKGKLLELDPGSLVIFGSTVNGAFLLDTVFVVRARLNAYRSNEAVGDLRGLAPDSFFHAVAEPVQDAARPPPRPSCIAPGTLFVLYEGATPQSLVDGMFSFVPSALHPGVFARPATLAAGINPASTQIHKMLVAPAAVAQVRSAWNELVKDVLGSGLLLGVRFDLVK